MATRQKSTRSVHSSTARNRKPHLAQATNELLHNGQDSVYKLYETGMDKIDEINKKAHEITDEWTLKVKNNPVGAVLVAAGIGFILSRIFHRH